MALFTKDGEQINNLVEMQAMWYELETGAAHAAAGDNGRALKVRPGLELYIVYASDAFCAFALPLFAT